MPKKDRAEYNEHIREYMLRRYHERRRKAIKQLGGKCMRCGTRAKLEIDHIDPKKKSFAIGRLWSASQKKFDAELRKCQLLCERHHSDKTLADRGQKRAKGTHGTLSSYAYCKCDLCREVHSAYCREYDRKRRESRRSSTG